MNVLTMGTFDTLHLGHLHLFEVCAQLSAGGRVTVAVNTDEFVTRYKRQPLMTYAERAALVGSLRTVDTVLGNDGTDQRALIDAVMPDLIAIGSDWAGKDYYAQLDLTQEWLDARGIILAYVPRVGGWSSTAVKARTVAEAEGVGRG